MLNKLTAKTALLAFEKHYTPVELAKLWGLAPTTVRRMLENEPGILKLVTKRRGTREYCTMRIPQSVVEHFHAKLSGGR